MTIEKLNGSLYQKLRNAKKNIKMNKISIPFLRKKT